MADEKRPDVSIFVPALNEEGNVTPFVEKVAKAFAGRGLDGEIILVNDGSTDGTRREAETCAARYPFVHIINHARPLGITEAMRQGFRRASGEVIMFLPCDLESDPEEDIPRLLDKLSEGYDVVAGWRQGKRTHNVLVSKIYNAVSRRLFNLDIHDMNWIKAFRREVVESISLRSDWHRFILPMAAAQAKIDLLPCLIQPDDADELVKSMSSNIHRDKLSAEDEAKAIERLREQGYSTRKQIATKLAITEKRVKEREQLLLVPEVIRPRIGNGIPMGCIDVLAIAHRVDLSCNTIKQGE